MPKFKVVIRSVCESSIEVSAKNCKEAERLAEQMWEREDIPIEDIVDVDFIVIENSWQ